MEYYYLCKDCEYLYHCFERKEAELIEVGEIDLNLSEESCLNYYPLIKQ